MARSPCVWWTVGSAIEQSPCAPPVQGAHMKMIVRSFVFGPEKGGLEGREREPDHSSAYRVHEKCVSSAYKV